MPTHPAEKVIEMMDNHPFNPTHHEQLVCGQQTMERK
jgi:hypothetical protein